MFRIIASVIIGLTGAVVAARSVAKTKVKDKKASLIEATYARAREEIKGKTDSFLQASLKSFAKVAAIKLIIIGALFAAYLLNWIAHQPYRFTLITILIVLSIWDIVRHFATIRALFSLLVKYGINPKRALSEIVAAHIFNAILEEGSANPPAWHINAVLLLAGTHHSELTEEISNSVSKLAAASTWHDIRPFILIATIRLLFMISVYSIAVWTLLEWT